MGPALERSSVTTGRNRSATQISENGCGETRSTPKGEGGRKSRLGSFTTAQTESTRTTLLSTGSNGHKLSGTAIVKETHRHVTIHRDNWRAHSGILGLLLLKPGGRLDRRLASQYLIGRRAMTWVIQPADDWHLDMVRSSFRPAVLSLQGTPQTKSSEQFLSIAWCLASSCRNHISNKESKNTVTMRIYIHASIHVYILLQICVHVLGFPSSSCTTTYTSGSESASNAVSTAISTTSSTSVHSCCSASTPASTCASSQQHVPPHVHEHDYICIYRNKVASTDKKHSRSCGFRLQLCDASWLNDVTRRLGRCR